MGIIPFGGDTSRFYELEARKDSIFDATPGNKMGMLLHQAESQGSTTAIFIVELPLGKTFSDQANNIEITHLSKTDNTITVNVDRKLPNNPPDCTGAAPSQDSIFPPNHKMIDISINGVIDPDDDTVTILIDAIEQDESVNGEGDGNTSPDGIINGDTAQVRAERSGAGDGRIYEISFSADDGNSGTCSGSVTVGVPHDKKDTAVDSGVRFNSTS